MADTRVLCCPVNPHLVAMKALAEHAPETEIVSLQAEDTYGYWREIKSRWTGTQDLILIEQDNEIQADTISSLRNCPEPWCVFAYTIFRNKTRLKFGLGCTKISASAQRLATPELIEQGFWLCASCKGKGCWWHLDGRITEVLRGRGFEPHVHGDVTHLHDYGNAAEPKEGVWELPWQPGGVETGPARQVIHDIPWEFALTPVKATKRANELAELALQVGNGQSEDSSDLTSGSVIYPAAITGPAAPFSTDKIAHGYMPAYHRIAAALGPAARVCEIGVYFGGSLATWQVIFPGGIVAGVDNSPDARWPDGAIEIHIGQDDSRLPGLLAPHAAKWDLIIDDASHDGKLSARTLELLWPLVAPGGFYVIEDWFVGYSDYPGYDSSMLELAQSLLERLHDDTDTDSIEYRHGMAILRKKA